MCDHKNFTTQVNTTRLTDKGNVTGYTTDITIHCSDCLKPFQWIGVPMGYSAGQPMVSVDGLELRAPIKPVI